jgi:small-conductance mechanosensitive channel
MSTAGGSVTQSGILEALPKVVHEHWSGFVVTPLRIVITILVALLLRWLLHRLINRAVRPATRGEVPKILRPLKERAHTAALLESSGLLSERRAQRAATIGSVLKSGVSFTLFVIAALLVIGDLGVNLAPFIAGTSIVGVAVGFGAQNIVGDFLSGMFMMLEDQYGVGDVIDFEQASGTVEAVGLRTTRLRDVNGTVWYVRNGVVVRVGNMSQGFATVVLDVPIDAWADVGSASEAMLAVARAMRDEEEWASVFLSEPEVQGVEALTRYETRIRVVARVRPLEQWRTARELRQRIRARLDELGLSTRPAQALSIDPESLPPNDSGPSFDKS